MHITQQIQLLLILTSYYRKMNVYITLEFRSWFSTWSFYKRFPNQNFVWISCLPHNSFMPC